MIDERMVRILREKNVLLWKGIFCIMIIRSKMMMDIRSRLQPQCIYLAKRLIHAIRRISLENVGNR